MILQAILDAHYSTQFMRINGFDSSVIGVNMDNPDTPILVYSISLILATLCEGEGMTKSDAWDYLDMNILCSLTKGKISFVHDDY